MQHTLFDRNAAIEPRPPTNLPPTGHDPVLLAEVLEHLAPQSGQVIVDCTLGRAGHSRAIAPRLQPDGKLIGLDVDPHNLEFARTQLQGLPVNLFHANFAELEDVLDELEIEQVDSVFADLGISTNQLFESQYGLSFTNNVPLDMRLDPRSRESAADIVNRWPEEKFANLLFNYAQERYSRRIARKIAEVRRRSPIKTTEHLAELVRSVIPIRRDRHRRDKTTEIDPATRTFLALRMAVNGELTNLETLLKIAPRLVKPGGKIAIISFHSTEDRVVKQAFRSLEQTGSLRIITKKPLAPTDTEIAANPRSRSAKLRVASVEERAG